ncbi:MAG: hypothetical protein IKQ85_03050 [Bacteroidaceae bacterium]|nr:hypothetical protein [Bacteroidaceae bacterium]
MDANNTFSFFGKGHYSKSAKKCVPSVTPQDLVNIEWVYRYIISERARWATEELRRKMLTAKDDQELRDFKLLEFEAVAFSGTFSHGCAKGVIQRSEFICLDIDNLNSTEEAREVQQKLIADKKVETALCFVSPKGHGTKWIVVLPDWCQEFPFAEQYATLSRYIGYEYGLQADLTCSNVNRLCFLPFDPKCFINQKFISK